MRTISDDRLSLEEIVERVAWKLCFQENEVWDEAPASYRARWRREAAQMIADPARIDALRAPPSGEAGEVRVKPIEWQVNSASSVWSGELAFNTFYTIYDEGNGHRCFRGQFLSESGEDEIAYHPSLDATKAAAQSDYETRIRSALLPTIKEPTDGK